MYKSAVTSPELFRTAIATFPDNVSAAAISIAVAAGGAIQLKTTPLLSMEEGLEATKNAGQVGYRPPGS